MHYISFVSEGEPNDKGLNLSGSQKILTEALNKTDLKYFFYTPKYLKDNGYGEFVKEHDNSGLVSANPKFNLLGFAAWKPLVMLLELEKMNDGDILIYRDGNCEKYPQLKNFTNFENSVHDILKIANFDIAIPQDNPGITVGQYCKSNVIEELAIDKEFTRHSPLLIAYLIICRKSKTSMEILEEWKKNCLIDKYINGEQYGELYGEFMWSTPEQSILSVLMSNYVHQGKYNIPKNYPNFTLGDRDIYKPMIVKKDESVEPFSNLLSNESHFIVTGISLFAILALVIYNHKSIYKRLKKLIYSCK